MKKQWVFAFFLTALAAVGLHFVYDICPVPLVGLFTPVNESVWEHLKLLFWPFLAAGFLLSRKESDEQRIWSGILLSLIIMPIFLIGMYYLLKAGFGIEALWIDLVLFFLTLALGFWLAYRVWKSGRLEYLAGVLVILAGLYGAALILFTIAPPELPIFIPGV